MPAGTKSKYTDSQKRKAEHIEEGYEKRGVSKSVAETRAWKTVNKQDGGGKKSGNGSTSSKSGKAKAGAKKGSRSGAKKSVGKGKG